MTVPCILRRGALPMLTLLALLGVPSARAQSAAPNLTITLDQAGVFTVTPGNQVSVTGTLYNIGSMAVDLSSASLNKTVLPDPGAALSDDITFQLTGTLAAGGSQHLTFLTLDASGIPSGTSYAGSLSVDALGVDGTTPFTSQPVSTAFALSVQNAVPPTPEPSTGVTLTLAALGVAGLVLRGRRGHIA